MNWHDLTVGKKIAVGFGVTLTLLGVVGLLSYNGVGRIVKNAGQVIEGNKLDANLAQKEVDHLNWANKVNALLSDENVIWVDVQTDHRLCAFGTWLYGEGRREAEALVPSLAPLLKEIEEPHKKVHGSAIEIKKYYSQADAMTEGMKHARRTYVEKTLPALHQTQELIARLRKEAKNNTMTDVVMLKTAQETRRNVILVGAVAIVFGLLLAFVIARGITSALQEISTRMNQGVTQVATGSGQVSSSSQQLANGASEQAASIEETSASMEELSSMTKQNADNADQADKLMKESNQVVLTANGSMIQLTTSMDDIRKASVETSKIIKTIDEIAFQTNLLALNAAVEAARAGEAGAGFAVVADEVRNLAIRAADAARNTAELIEGTVIKVNDGSELVTHTNGAFANVAKSSRKVGELVGEIAAASVEQAQGIELTNRAIAEMDRVVQENAANAEETASASEEMHAQAEQMKSASDELMAMVGGAGARGRQVLPAGGKPVSRPARQTLAPSEKTPGIGKRLEKNAKEVTPDQIIPMDDDEFQDF